MPRFDILVPKSDVLPMDLKLRLDAKHWTAALKAGLEKVGESAGLGDNVLCDIQPDGSIHVTELSSKRVFRITEVIEEAPEEGVSEPAAPQAEEPPPDPAPAPEIAQPEPQPKPPVAPPPQAQTAPPPPAPEPEPVLDAVKSAPIGRSLPAANDSQAALLEDVFEQTMIVQQAQSTEEALYMMLDLAMEKIKSDSGSVLLADINNDKLSFGAARGPKAKEVMGFKVAMGQGLVGFSAEIGVGLAVSDANRDPRFYAAISEKIGYPTRSILCVPLIAEDQVLGAMELINRQAGDSFSDHELQMAAFIARQLAQYLLRSSQAR